MVLRRSLPALIASALIIFCVISSANAQTIKRLGAVEAGNDIYRIYVEEDAASGRLGTYTAATGPEHTVKDANILRGAKPPPANPWSTYLSVRSYSTEQIYVSREVIPGVHPEVTYLSDYGIVSANTADIKTTWVLPGPPETPDKLTIVQDIVVIGEEEVDSMIRVTVSVRNDGPDPVNIGVRYLWDLKIDINDFSEFRTHDPISGWTDEFIDFDPPNFRYFETTDFTTRGTFSIYGTVTGEYEGLEPPPTPANRFKYASWDTAYSNPWNFPVNGSGGDSSVVYYWGSNSGNALHLEPGEEKSVTAYLMTVVPPDPPAPKDVPALDEWGFIIMISILGMLIVLKRRAAI
jgi:hypothetical protein